MQVNKKSILIVDDTSVNIDLLLEILKDRYEIVVALDAKSALEIVNRETIDLILLDILMPDIDGYEMCLILKKDDKTKDIPVIFITAKIDEESIEKAYDVGGIDYITKPFKPKELLARIKRELKLQELIYDLEESKNEIIEINQNLQLKVDEELKKSRDKDKMIFHQNKMSSMGEMIGNIAHQWKQPLAQVNSIVLLLDDILYTKKIQDDAIEEKLLEIESLTIYMSRTIDDFKNFYSQDKHKEEFILQDLIEKSIFIVQGVLDSHNIKIILNLGEKSLYTGHKNELQQVLVVLLNNAKDALVFKDILNPTIKIECKKSGDAYCIEVCDNAGGVNDAIIEKIFEPYFSTKHKKQGVGLGLYISKKIIEDSLDGELSVQNSEHGACFKINL